MREGQVPELWKTADVIPLPKSRPAVSVDKDIRPISLTPIVAKVFETLLMKRLSRLLKIKSIRVSFELWLEPVLRML